MIRKYIQTHKEQIINDLCDLVRIPSVSETEHCKTVLKKICELYEQNGFESQIYEDYLLSHYKKGSHTIGLFAHADVVDGGNGWIMCQSPFEPTIKDGVLYGRGVSDNKSAVVISLYALKIIKELGIDFNSSLLCFAGANEETTMQDVKNYAKSHTPPDFSLVLDAGFPVYLGDKGILWLSCTLNNELCDLISLQGGTATNIILGKANARVKYSAELYDELASTELEISREDDEILISAQGISNHGAMPYGTKNAAGMIISALLNAPSFSKTDKDSLALLNDLLTTYDGTPLEINAYDETFRDTTATNGIVDIKDGKLTFTLDIRYGKTYKTTELLSKIDKILTQGAISYKIVKQGEPSCVDPDNKYAVACYNAYVKHTGNTDAKMKINAGGTYSRFLPNSVETGTTLIHPQLNLPSGHGFAHQADEFISIDGLLEALELIVKMLIECDKLNK